MKIETIKASCTGCMACLSVCPKCCITSNYDEYGFYYPKINKDNCISCLKCEKNCHILNPISIKSDFRKSYYGKSKDKNVLMKSTSGGVFYHLANYTINLGGNVYGAFFDSEDRRLKHKSYYDVGINELLKSKYIESDMGDTIKAIQNDIDKGTNVLLCGTPCEISGARKAIHDPNNLLILVDFICHGVPSSKLFMEHIKRKIKNDKLISLSFRSKDLGWSSKQLIITTNKKKIKIPYQFDEFYSGFMTHNSFLRESCYNCKFRENHYSDITIGDFWQYKELDTNLNVKDGLSLIVTNSKRGDDILNSISNEFELNEINNEYTKYAFQCRDYSKYYEKRKKFYDRYFKYGFKRASKIYMKGVLIIKIKYKIKKIIKGL